MEIISGYGRQCKNSLGGINKIWLTRYVKYNRSKIITNDNYLISFPSTIIYEFKSLQNPTFTETVEFSDGGDFYNQTVSLVFSKKDAKNLRYLKCLDFRIIVQDNNGVLHIFGLNTGLSITGINYTTGGNKNDLNGIKIDFTGQEEHSAYFISNPADAGFIDLGTDEPFYFLYQNEDRFLLQDSNFLLN